MNEITSKKTVHCIHYVPKIRLESGGVVRFVLDVCQVLSDQGLKVTLITQDAKDVPANWFADDEQPNVVEIKQPRIYGGLLTPKSLKKVAAVFSENTVINFHIPWVLSNFQLARLANKHKVRYIVTPHGSLDRWSMEQKQLKKTIFWICFGKRHYRDACCIHYTAESEREQGEKYIVKESVSIIPCLFDSGEFRNLPDVQLAREKFEVISTDRPNILFLSRLHPKKGADLLVIAAKILADKAIKFNILLAGPEPDTVKGYREELNKMIKDRQLENSVHLIGMVRGQEKLSLYRLSDLFVLPTHQENFGFVLVEAMACGVPVLTSYGVDIWKEIQRGGATIINNEPTEIAAAIERLLADKQVLKATGNKSRAWVFQEFDAEKLAKDYSSMYISAAET